MGVSEIRGMWVLVLRESYYLGVYIRNLLDDEASIQWIEASSQVDLRASLFGKRLADGHIKDPPPNSSDALVSPSSSLLELSECTTILNSLQSYNHGISSSMYLHSYSIPRPKAHAETPRRP